MKVNQPPSKSEIILNIISFLPYFFAVEENIKSFFAPWKAIELKEFAGENVSFWQKLIAKFTSRLIGMMMKSALLFAYLFFQVGLIIFLPFLFVILSVTEYLQIFSPKPSATLPTLEEFNSKHDPQGQNLQFSQEWYSYLEKNISKPAHPLSLESLLKIPPLSKDWNYAYTPTLQKYAIDLTQPQKHWDHLLDRQIEIEKISSILSSTDNSHILLYGSHGIGKHSIIEALCRSIYYNHTLPALVHKKVFKLDLSSLLANVLDKNERNIILENLLNEAKEARNIILLIDDFALYTNPKLQNQNFTSSFSKFLIPGNLSIIGLCDKQEFSILQSSSTSLVQQFNLMEVQSVSTNVQKEILFDLAYQKEVSETIICTSGALELLLEQSQQLISNIPLPELSIKIFLEASSLVQNKDRKILDLEQMNQALSQYSPTNIPSQETLENIKNFSSYIKTQILGQESALETITSQLSRAYIAPSTHTKPIISFLFLGPTGVGKTATAKAITNVLYRDPKKLLRFDLSNFQTDEAIASLLGDKSSQEIGMLTSSISSTGGGVILLDEIEKAPAKILNIFLSILDEGYFTDLLGNTVNCRSFIIIATSNVLAEKLSQEQAKINQKAYLDALVASGIFSREFLARFDSIVFYEAINVEQAIAIAQIHSQKLTEIFQKSHKRNLVLNNEKLKAHVRQVFDPEFGARDIKRQVESFFANEFANELLGSKQL